jgi:CheY-like chemotaxis protein
MAEGEEFAPGDALRSVEILYVDDESQRRDLMRRTLMSLGARRVQVAESGAEGLKVVLGTTWTGIVEHKMTPMDGIAFVLNCARQVIIRALVPALVLANRRVPTSSARRYPRAQTISWSKPISPAKLYEQSVGRSRMRGHGLCRRGTTSSGRSRRLRLRVWLAPPLLNKAAAFPT